MGTAAPVTIQRQADLLADALQQVAREFVTAARGRAGEGRRTGAPALVPIEAAAVASLRSDPAEVPQALVVLRIIDDLRRIVRLIEELPQPLARAVPGVSEELLDHLHRMADLTTAQLEAGADCLRGREMAQVQRVLLEESALDNWYDLLLTDALDDVGQGRSAHDVVLPLLAIARRLERIGGHACHITESTLALARPDSTAAA